MSDFANNFQFSTGRQQGRTLVQLLHCSRCYVNGEDINIFVPTEQRKIHLENLANKYGLPIPEIIVLPKENLRGRSAEHNYSFTDAQIKYAQQILEAEKSSRIPKTNIFKYLIKQHQEEKFIHKYLCEFNLDDYENFEDANRRYNKYYGEWLKSLSLTPFI